MEQRENYVLHVCCTILMSRMQEQIALPKWACRYLFSGCHWSVATELALRLVTHLLRKIFGMLFCSA